ncbi:NMI protein, partial [Odontophorus gujanensis]|nr:NMI protein [Odontophorus gujanensis]
MAGCTVQVWGIPSDLPPDRVVDKLTIHFLRSRNGGGEITDVQVLPGSPACALITFEALAVAQHILKVKNHVLCIGGKKYPLEVTAHVVKLSPDEVQGHRTAHTGNAHHCSRPSWLPDRLCSWQTCSGKESLLLLLILVRYCFYSNETIYLFF